jgi:hypothetical protein
MITDKLGVMPTRASRERLGGRVGVKAPTGTPAHQSANWQLGERQAQLHRIIPGVEREDGSSDVQSYGRDLTRPRVDLFSRHQSEVFSRRYAPHPQRSRPTRAAQRDLDQPRLVPARDDRLAMRMARRVMVVAPLGTGLRITPRPDARVHRVPGRWWFDQRPRRGRDERFESRQIPGPRVERTVETAPPAPAGGRQAQARWRFQRRGPTTPRRAPQIGRRVDTQTTRIRGDGRLEALPMLACSYPERWRLGSSPVYSICIALLLLVKLQANAVSGEGRETQSALPPEGRTLSGGPNRKHWPCTVWHTPT